MLTLDEMRELSAWQLAQFAECATPDTSESPGAEMLTSVRDALAERIDWVRESGDSDTSLSAIVATLQDDGSLSEIADGAPNVYTHKRWSQFLDLAAYSEQPEISDAWSTDLTEAAGQALYQIADRLVNALASELAEDGDE